MARRKNNTALFVHGLGGLGRGVERGLQFASVIGEREIERQRYKEKQVEDERRHREQLRMSALPKLQDQTYPDPENPKRTVTIPGVGVSDMNKAFPGKEPLFPADFEAGARGRPMGSDTNNIKFSAEARREKNFLAQQFEKESSNFKESVDAYQRARANYNESVKAPNTASDKNLVLNYISAEQGNRITDKDYVLGAQQGSWDQKVTNWYSTAVNGTMTPAVRNQIMDAVKASVRGREEVHKENIEKVWIQRAIDSGVAVNAVVRELRPPDWNTEFMNRITNDDELLQILKSPNPTPEQIESVIRYRQERKGIQVGGLK